MVFTAVCQVNVVSQLPSWLPPANAVMIMHLVVSACNCVCLSVCLFCFYSNFWKLWCRNFIFSMWVQLQNILVVYVSRSLGQGQGQDNEEKMGCECNQINERIHRWFSFGWKNTLVVLPSFRTCVYSWDRPKLFVYFSYLSWDYKILFFNKNIESVV